MRWVSGIGGALLVIAAAGCAGVPATPTAQPTTGPGASPSSFAPTAPVTASPAGQSSQPVSTVGPSTLPAGGLQGVTALAIGSHSCAILRDGTMACWGGNDYGQLGDGSTRDRAQPAIVPGLSGVTAVAAGDDHTCAVHSDGAVACWGDNRFGQLGDGSTTQRSLPVAVAALTGATAIAAGTAFTCAVLQDSSVACWGAGHSGQLGDGTSAGHRPRPGPVPDLAGVTALALGSRHACALVRDGTVACWGDNYHGGVGDGTTTDRSRPVTVASGVTALATGNGHTCVQSADAGLGCWGFNQEGQLGVPPTGTSPHPDRTRISLAGVTALAAGNQSTCALLIDGTAACWGYNVVGQLGDGSTRTRYTPAAVPGLVGIAALSVGSAHACALLRDSTVVCWGYNWAGQVGDGSTENRSRPVPVAGLVAVPPPVPFVQALVERQLRSSRQPILDALAKLGYQCGPEQRQPNSLPTVACTFPGARPKEGVLMFAAENDFRGIGAFSYDRVRLVSFLAALGSQGISDDLMTSIDGIIRLGAMPDSRCPLPCGVTTSGPAYGKLEGRAQVDQDMLMYAILQERGF